MPGLWRSLPVIAGMIPSQGDVESFFQFNLRESAADAPSSIELVLARYVVQRPDDYEQLWLESTGLSIFCLLESQSLRRPSVEQLARETFRYWCKLRGYNSPWLRDSGKELLAKVIEHQSSGLGAMPLDPLRLVAKCRYNPPEEIARHMRLWPELHGLRSSGSSSPSFRSTSTTSTWRYNLSMSRNLGRQNQKQIQAAEKHLNYRYRSLMSKRSREISEGANKKSNTTRP